MRKIILIILILLVVLYSPNVLAYETYTKQEIEVAKVISAEACSEGKIGMWAVANTIANRSRTWNKTPYEIVTQKNQYYGYTNPNKEEIYLGCKRIANELSKHIMQLKDITNGAMYYLLPNERLRKWHGEKTVVIGKHTFYKENIRP